jgi:hypothetical protein
MFQIEGKEKMAENPKVSSQHVLISDNQLHLFQDKLKVTVKSALFPSY